MSRRRHELLAPTTRKLRFDSLEDRLNPASATGWEDLAVIPASKTGATAYVHPEQARAVDIDLSAMQAALADSPAELALKVGAAPVTLSLPAPDGTLQRFAILDSIVMAPELAAQFPEIQTFQGYGLDDPTANLRMDITPQGFHAQVISPNGTWYIDPYYHLETDVHISYYRRALDANDVYALLPDGTIQTTRDNLKFNGEHTGGGCNCLACSLVLDGQTQVGPQAARGSGTTANRSGTQLRTYRLAVAATGEYTAFHGGTVAAGQAAVVTSVNRVSGIYESELSIRLVLVPNNSTLIYTDSASDPYTNNDGFTMLSQNQANVANLIGEANFDIGHVYSTGGGGVAGLGVVGLNGQKARGVTGSGSPVGDPFWVDYVAHEMGHQFGANHSFNTSTDGNRNASTAYEPGSASTIMGYAGITGADSDLQPNSDPYFNLGSFDEIIDFVDNDIPTVGTRTATGNTVPTVEAGVNYVIPARTPFVLTATGSDANGDTVTYSWEQRDLGPANTLSSVDNGTSPLFRVYNPTTDPSRTFPRLTDLVNNVNTIPLGEKLPTTNRTAMKFRVTARDNRVNGGGVNTDDMQVQVVNTGTPFAVTSPNTAMTWVVGQQEAVTWDVAGTTAAPISAANVNITLSLDGGLTYPVTLASNVPNNGSATITVPNNATTTARVRVQAAGNIFFDISNANFTISTTAPTYNVSGKMFEDWNGDGAFDAHDKPVAGQTILFDTNNNGVVDTQTFNSGTVNVPIPDNNTTGAISTINVTGMPTSLVDVNVRVTIAHTWIEDVDLYLTSPSGTTIPLILDRGADGDNMTNTVFDDEAAVDISAGTPPFTGTFRPESPLSAFDGSNPNGTWTLRGVDDEAIITGTISNWSLIIVRELTTTTDGAGNYRVSGLGNGTYQVRPVLTGYNLVAPASGSHIVTITAPTDTNPNLDFAVGLQNAIYGLVVADGNSNGTYETASDPGISGVQVYRDTNNNGTFNAGEPTQTSDAFGRYQFTSQPTGAAVIRDVLTGTQVQSFPAGGVYNLNMTANASLFANNFGIIVGSAPTITSNGGTATVNLNFTEGFTDVTTVTATDPDAGTTITYSIVGGLDASKFQINSSTGQLSFQSAPLFATPTDSNGDNAYLVTVQASDGLLFDQQAFTINVVPGANDAPVLDTNAQPKLAPIANGMTNPAGNTVTDIVGTSISDPDPFPLEGIAVVALSNTSDGTWQFSLDGTTWQPFGSVSESTARVLLPDDLIRFVPNVGFIDVVTFTFRAWDQTTDAAGDVVNLTGANATGGESAYSVATLQASLRVAMTLTPTGEDATKHKGDATSLLLTNFVQDNDVNAKGGMAIIGVQNDIAGVWQYSANGRSWKTLPTVSLASALLLKSTDRVRFLPATDQVGYAMIEYHAWDQTIGKRATLVDLTVPNATGGNSAFSASSDVAFAQVLEGNDKPVLDAGGVALLTTVATSDPDPAGDTVATLLKGSVVDSDPGAVRGIAVVGQGKGLQGTWQFSTDAGATWQPFPLVTVKAALLLREQDMVRFVPTSGFTGSATFSFKAWDQTEGTFGTASTSTVLKTSLAFSTVIDVATVFVGSGAPTNNAPVLNTTPSPSFTVVEEDSKKPKGDMVSSLLLLGTTITDSDFAALKGIAVVGLTGTANGRWEWSLNGRSWKPVAPVSEASALLLREGDRLRYVPNADSVASATVQYRAWDQTRGSAGNRADLTIVGGTGGTSPFSTAIETATVNISAINDAPLLKTSSFPVLTPPASTDPGGILVSSFANALITDVDAGAVKGIAVTRSNAPFGNWEFSLNNGATWSIFPLIPALSDKGALLLKDTDLIRVKPFVGGSGVAMFNFRAWDRSVGTAGTVLSTKGSTAFSKSFETVTVGYNNGNDRPMMDITPNPVLAHPAANSVASLVGTSITDPDVTDLQGIAVTLAVSSLQKGAWEFSLDNGSTWTPMGKVSAASGLMLRPTDLIRFNATSGFLGVLQMKYKAWDQSTGTAGQKAKTTTTAFSKEVETATMNINTAPEFVL